MFTQGSGQQLGKNV